MNIQEKMKKVGISMNFLMGLTMSFFLSLIQNILSGRFSMIMFLITFAVSFLISLLIGFLIPMKSISDAATKKMKPGSFPAICLESFISDLIYTPLITLAMITLVRNLVPYLAGMSARKSGAPEEAAVAASLEAASTFPPFIMMFLSSFAVCMVIGFVLIFLFQPLYVKLLLKKYGIPAGAQRK